VTKKEQLKRARAKRSRWCPVREKSVTEYLLPLDCITRDVKKSQVRTQDSSSTTVAELRDDIHENGQELGICIGWSKEDGCFVVYWGNTRYRGIIQLQTMDLDSPPKDLEIGYIWASVFQGTDADKLRLQAKENNIHKPATRATVDDNKLVICKMIIHGHLDVDGSKYEELSLEDKKARVRKAAQECSMPMNKFTSLWNRVKKADPSTIRTFRTWDKEGDMLNYFNSHNPWDANVTGSGDVFSYDDNRIGIYFTSQAQEYAGALLVNSFTKRLINKDCDFVLVVSSFNGSSEKNVSNERCTNAEKVSSWHPEIKGEKCISEIWCLPQTEREQEDELVSGDFVAKKVFESIPTPKEKQKQPSLPLPTVANA
jgi:hypothetical protein